MKQKEDDFLKTLKFNVIPHKVEIHRDLSGFVFHKNDEDEIISENPRVRPNQLNNLSDIKSCTGLINNCLSHVNISKQEHI